MSVKTDFDIDFADIEFAADGRKRSAWGEFFSGLEDMPAAASVTDRIIGVVRTLPEKSRGDVDGALSRMSRGLMKANRGPDGKAIFYGYKLKETETTYRVLVTRGPLPDALAAAVKEAAER